MTSALIDRKAIAEIINNLDERNIWTQQEENPALQEATESELVMASMAKQVERELEITFVSGVDFNSEAALQDEHEMGGAWTMIFYIKDEDALDQQKIVEAVRALQDDNQPEGIWALGSSTLVITLPVWM